MKTYNEIFNEAFNGKEPENLDVAIRAMKDAGASIIDCITVIKRDLNLTIQEADNIVINSTAWGSEKAYAEKFREQFFLLAKKIR